MNGPDAPYGEMPGFPFPGRPGGEPDEPLLDMLIARRALPPGAPGEMHDLARMLAALAGPAEFGELAGEAAVRAAFSQAASPAGVSSAARRPVRRRRPRRSRRPVRSRAWLATAMVSAVAGLGSVLAAYSGVLPSPIQQLAHVAVAAPAPAGSGPHHSTVGPGRPTRPATQSASQSAGGSQRPAGATPSSSPAQSPAPGFKPERSRSPGRGGTSGGCGTRLYRSPPPLRSPSPAPTLRCTGFPTGPSAQPTLNPYVP